MERKKGLDYRVKVYTKRELMIDEIGRAALAERTGFIVSKACSFDRRSQSKF